MALAIALLTILAPIISVLVVAWAESLKQKREAQPDADIDEHIKQHLAGNKVGLINLSVTLERLQQEADRKRRHS